MSNYQNTKSEVYNYIKARIPLIIIETAERERAERMLSQIAHELSTELLYYTEATQVTRLDDSAVAARDASGDPLLFMAQLFCKRRKVIFCYGDVSKISEDTIYSREIINILYAAVKGESTLILITNDPVYSRIAQFGMIAKLDYPDDEERIKLIRDAISRYSSRYYVEWDDEDTVVASAMLSGFSEVQINNILSNELAVRSGLYKDGIRSLAQQKSKLYGAVSNVQKVYVDADMMASGLENLKAWLAEKKRIFFATDEQLHYYGLAAPKGILLAGVPGCGKSFSAKLIAKEWGMPLFRFDIGSIYDKWMGESERKMKEALAYIDNVAPCVLWIDEIEKALSVSNGENDTGKRILGQFLFWLQESQSRVFLVATANEVELLPPELFRKGRFSEVFFVDLPTAQERRQVIEQYALRCLHLRFSEPQMESLIEASAGFSYSEIEYAVKEVAQRIFLYGKEGVTLKSVLEVFGTVVPIEKSRREDVDRIRAWGRERAVSASVTDNNEETDV